MIDDKIISAVILDMKNCFSENDGRFSDTRDVFSARLQSFIIESKKYLEAAIIGEIGNNTFDHNFGFNGSLPKGVYWDLSYLQKYIILADYGKGLKESLKQVLPSMDSDIEAIETAFTKRISGRSPEQRGNGLKFVCETIKHNNWFLYFQSGTGSCTIEHNGIRFFEGSDSVTGCLAIIDFTGG